MSGKFLGLTTYCIVTGASQGIGSKIAVELARKFSKGSLILLLARSLNGLNKTKELILEANPDVSVLVHSVDLSKPSAEEYSSIIKSSLHDSNVEASAFALSMIVHNAGSVGDVQEFCVDMCDVDKIQHYFSLNLFSTMCLSSVFLKIFNQKTVNNRLVINITSLCAIKPMKSMGYYCTGKASREMYFKVLAEENPGVSVLSYSPGPVNTDMISNITQNIRDNDVKNLFVSMRDSGSVLSVDQTVTRFINILDKGEFQSGSRIDYFDPDN